MCENIIFQHPKNNFGKLAFIVKINSNYGITSLLENDKKEQKKNNQMKIIKGQLKYKKVKN